LLPLPDWSAAVVPLLSSRAQAPFSPAAAVFCTVTPTPADVVVFPAPSRATAVSVCGPFPLAKVSHEAEYGALVSSAPRFAPSTLNWTPATEPLSAAFAVTATVDATVAPAAGAVIDTVGGVVSDVAVALASLPAGPTLPAGSSAVTL